MANTVFIPSAAEPQPQDQDTTSVRDSSSRWKHLRADWWKHLLLLTISFFLFFPFLVTLSISFKDLDQFATQPFWPTFPLNWGNYKEAGDIVIPFIVNSIVICGVTCVGVVLIGALTAWVFANYEFPGREILYYLILALLMVPSILTLIPTFVVVSRLHMLDTRWALILPWIAGGQVFAIFILRTFFAALPKDLFEAARLDGAGELAIFARIGLPLSRSILGVVAIFNILGTWNDFLWPLVTLTNKDIFPLVLGLYRFQSEYYTIWGPLMAGYVIGTIPLIILFMFTSKLFVQGLAAGGIKL